jgi:hypothetical protein
MDRSVDSVTDSVVEEPTSFYSPSKLNELLALLKSSESEHVIVDSTRDYGSFCKVRGRTLECAFVIEYDYNQDGVALVSVMRQPGVETQDVIPLGRIASYILRGN